MSFLQQVNNMSAKWPMLNTKPRSKALPVPRESKMVGATASALMGVMAPLLSKLIFMEDGYGMLRNLQPGITSLRGELGSMKAALEELSRLEQPSSPVREWMGQLRELSYNIEDCVDGFAHGLGQDVDPDGEGLLGKIAGWIEAVRRYHRTAGRIAELKEHAVEVSHRRKRLKLEDIAPSAAGAAMAIDPRLPALFEEADRVIGIDGPREELVGWLVGATTGSASQRRVVSIVGCAGLGKTTLANQVYHRIKGQFDCTAFVSVSRSPNVIKILTDVLLQFLGANNSVLDDDNQRGYLELVGIMREYLRDKRYFVLIDDIWSKQAWSAIQCAFPSNDNASRIMTTTRIQDVAKSCSFPHGGCVYPMKHLGINDSKRLFLKRIFDHEDDCPLELKEVTDDILKKCDGLPLAIVNIASMLATKPTTKQEWGRVRISLCSSHEQDPELDIVKRILFLSYYDLPHYLKICLLDISIFPEDFEICCERLVQRWMAEGFIIEHRGQCLEDTGRSYISELINRNMIQLVDIDSISGRPVACRLHDIMLDLIISLSAKENFVTIMDDENLAPPSKTIRRLSIQGKCERWTLPPGTKKLSHVRSLTVFSDAKKMPLLLDFQVLRVLDLQGCSHVEDGDIMDIGCLIHLRFLSLRKCSRVTEIPRQIGKMQHLQTLDLTFTGIKRLPGTVARLRQLVHLLIPQGVQLPVGIGNMESLEELYWFDVRVISPEVVLELGNMTKLKDLSINWELDDATRDEGRYQNYLMSSLSKLGEHDLRHLEFFMYNGSGSADFLVDSWCPPPRHLQTFKMNSGITTFLSRLPRWISSLSELTCLDIPIKQVGHGDLQVLADLPILLHLGLHLRESPQETLIISPRGFQSLKYLFVGTWGRGGLGLMFEKGAMPKLEKLYCASVARDTYDVGYEFGISQLTSLKHLHVSINCRGARAWEVEAAEGAIRNAAALLPNHPTPEIFRGFQKEMVQNEELMREGHWW